LYAQLAGNVSPIGTVATDGKVFSILRNEVKKIKVPETEKLANAFIGCYQKS